MSKNFDKLNKYLQKAAAYTSVLNLIDYDSNVNAPADSDMYTSKVTGIISNEYHDIFTDKEFNTLLDKCKKDAKNGKLTAVEKALVKEAVKKIREIAAIPASEYREFSELTAKSVNIWTRAKRSASFSEFAPQLKKIVDYKKKFAEYIKTDEKCNYDVLLASFEPEFMSDRLDDIFAQIKNAVIPLVKTAVNNQKKDETDYSFTVMKSKNDIEQLKCFCDYLAGYLGFNKRRGIIGESAHPFTINMHNHDVRITNNFEVKDMLDPIFSVIHETGHALYEQGIADVFTLTVCGEGTSMGMHEGQSRFFENMIGKRKSFWEPVYPRLEEAMPDKLSNVSLDMFMDAVNRVNPGPIRTVSDELTYPLHIIIRYELEKKLISGTIDVEELPDEWNKRYKKYLGITPSDDAEGVLQDVHWAAGEFGYFPSYLIGSAVAAQIYYHIESIMPVDRYLKEGNIAEIRSYLTENIYRYGKSIGTEKLLKKMTGNGFDVSYYIRYLTEKWGKTNE